MQEIGKIRGTAWKLFSISPKWFIWKFVLSFLWKDFFFEALYSHKIETLKIFKIKNKQNEISHGRGNSPRNALKGIVGVHYQCIVIAVLIPKILSKQLQELASVWELESSVLLWLRY